VISTLQASMFILLTLFLSGARGLKLTSQAIPEQNQEQADYSKNVEFQDLVSKFTRSEMYWNKVAESIDKDELVKAEGQYLVDGAIVNVKHSGRQNIGGDRMNPKRHDYAPLYAKHLTRLHDHNQSLVPTVVEIGILACTGLAMWSNIYPDSRILGFDWDTTPCKNNWDLLKTKGFKDAHVTVHHLDQMQNNEAMLRDILRDPDFLKEYSGKLNVVIDDGCHKPECAEKTFQSFHPFLDDHFAYFLEDTGGKNQYDPVRKTFKTICPDCQIDVRGQLTVVYK
jgi:hypothetical protein